MKNRLLTLALAVLSVGLMGSCSKESVDQARIASIENQIAAINSSIADLETVRKDISDLKAAEIAIGQRIDELKAYVGDLSRYADKDWATAAFATVEQLRATKTELEALKGTVSSINSAISALEARISALETRVSALEQMIQTVTVIPAYNDGSLKTEGGILTINCIIAPKEAVGSLKKENFTVLTSVGVTKAVLYGTISIAADEDLVIDKTDGTATIKVDVSSVLPAGEGKVLFVALNVRNGISDYTTGFVPVYSASPAPVADYVEIGGLKWATKNIGAAKETDFGYYFFWGGTQGYVYDSADSKWKKASDGEVLTGGFSFANVPYYDSVNSAYTKYTVEESVLEAVDDAAAAYLGDDWRIPTTQDFKDLCDACGGCIDYDKTTYASTPCGVGTSFTKGIHWCINYDGVSGVLFCDGTGKLFLPAAGYGFTANLNVAGINGCYWSSTLEYEDCAYSLHFAGSLIYPLSSDERINGFSVRPVSD